MLTAADIRARLRGGKLSLFPSDEDDVADLGVYLRIGTEFIEFPRRSMLPHASGTARRPARIEVGDKFYLHAGAALLVASLQYVVMPSDLAGTVYLRSQLVSAGLNMAPSLVSPGFEGKLVFALANLGEVPIALYPAMRFAILTLTQVVPPPPEPAVFRATAAPTNGDEDEIRELRRRLDAAVEEVKSDYTPPQVLYHLLADALAADREDRGRRLEAYARELIRTIDGLKLIAANARLRAEELDLVLQNDVTAGFWRYLGSPIVVECKNWSGKIGASHIGTIGDKLQSLGPDAKTTILLAPNGITGDDEHDAWLKVRELRQRGKYVIVLDQSRLSRIGKDRHAAEIIEEAFQQMWLI